MGFGRKQVLENRRRLVEREAVYRAHGYDVRKASRFALAHLPASSGRVLEIGTGKGRFLVALARLAARVVTVDPDAAEQRFARLNAAFEGVGRRIRFVVADGARLPFADASFDAVVSMNALHHIRNLDGVLDEILRVLRPGGRVLLADFDEAGFRMFDRIHRGEGRTHERFRYRWPHILARLRKAGFATCLKRGPQTVLASARPPLRPAMKRRPRALMLAVLLAALVHDGLAQGGPTRPEWQRRRAALERVHRAEEFRIFYTFDGPDALPDRDDVNRNGVPDRIENIALQLVVARTVYTNAMKLRHPLQSPRYVGRAKFIDVNVGALPFEPGGKKQNGGAGDAIVNYHRPGDPEGGVSVLTIDLANRLPPENLTPAHELFHSFQYGYTLFKNGWFLEGMARWSESALRAGAGPPGALPATEADLRKLFGETYGAAGFWNGIAAALDPDGRLALPAGLRESVYVGRTNPVIADDVLRGGALMRRILEAFDRADDAVSRRDGLDPLDWKETRQKAPENSPEIWSAVIEVLRSSTNPPPDLARMVKALGMPGGKG